MNNLFLVDPRITKFSYKYQQLPLSKIVSDNAFEIIWSTFVIICVVKIETLGFTSFDLYQDLYKGSSREEVKRNYNDLAYKLKRVEHIKEVIVIYKSNRSDELKKKLVEKLEKKF